MLINRYILGGVAFIVVIAAVWLHGNSTGKDSIRTEYQEQLIDAQDESRKLADALEAEKLKIKVKTVERIKEIKTAADPTGCADTTAPDWVR